MAAPRGNSTLCGSRRFSLWHELPALDSIQVRRCDAAMACNRCGEAPRMVWDGIGAVGNVNGEADALRTLEASVEGLGGVVRAYQIPLVVAADWACPALEKRRCKSNLGLNPPMPADGRASEDSAEPSCGKNDVCIDWSNQSTLTIGSVSPVSLPA